MMHVKSSWSSIQAARLWRTCALIAVFSAAAVDAEPTRKVEIVINEPCYSWINHRDIKVVVNGDETRQFAARWDAQSNHWKGDWPDPDPERTFNAADSRASVRLDGRRTECTKSFPIADRQALNRSVALFTFICDERAAQTVELRTNSDEIAIGYVRRLLKSSSACTEWGFFPSGPRTVLDIWPSETLRLQLGWVKEDFQAPGLLVASPDPRSPERLVFSAAVKRHAQKTDDELCKKSDDRLCLQRDGVVFVLRDQRAEGDGSPPNFSCPAIDIDVKALKEVGITSLFVTVVK